MPSRAHTAPIAGARNLCGNGCGRPASYATRRGKRRGGRGHDLCDECWAKARAEGEATGGELTKERGR